MGNENKFLKEPDMNFLSPMPFSLKAISQEWVNKRAGELVNGVDPGQPNVEGALYEAAQVLFERAGANASDDECAILYTPSNDKDPYIIGIPLDQRPLRSKRKSRILAGYKPILPKPTPETSIRLDFENLMFETVDGFNISDLDCNEEGEYKNPITQSYWKGFCMYHNKLTIVSNGAFKPKYSKTLGVYVVARVATNGTAVFTQSPFRHYTKAGALEEANRLTATHGSPFAIFRCLDIIDTPAK